MINHYYGQTSDRRGYGMRRFDCPLSCALLVLMAVASFRALASNDVNVPVRPIGKDQPAWNVRARAFMYPPTFLLKDGTGYSLERNWEKRPIGWVEVRLPDGTDRKF